MELEPMSDQDKKHVTDLIKKSAEANLACDAMQYAQAALNAANALMTLSEIRMPPVLKPVTRL
jgi:hypothetical protein